MNTYLNERFEVGDSLLHRTDARLKLVVALALIFGIVLTPVTAWPAYPLLWSLLASLAILGNVSPFRLARLGAIALPFTLAAATLLFTIPGRPLVSAFGLTISDAGLARFIAIVIKSWLAVQVTLLLSITTHFTNILWGLSSLHLPDTLVAIIGFMYRYLFTLKDEVDRLLRARTARSASLDGHKAGGSLLWRAQVAGGMVGNLFLRSYQRSERVYAAMLSRGYNGQMAVMPPPPLTVKALTYAVAPILILVLIEALALLYWNH